MNNEQFVVHTGDNLPILREMPDNSVDAIVTDPPYGLSFMGKRWDYDVPSVELWAECLRVLKPGGHLLAFAGTRTQHRMAVRIEDAGFEIRDMIAWVYGSGFPKSLDVSKAITNRAAPAKVREIKLWLVEQFENSGKTKAEINRECGFTASDYLKTEPGNDAGGRATWHLLLPYGEKWARLKQVVGFGDEFDAEIERYGVVASQRRRPKENREIYGRYLGIITDYELTDAAKQWDGWGTALKPALEPITLARKPLAERTVAANVLEWGTGGVNVDGCRVNTGESTKRPSGINVGVFGADNRRGMIRGGTTGRFPANLIHDGSDEVVGLFPVTTSGKDRNPAKTSSSGFTGNGIRTAEVNYGDTGSAARFFASFPQSKADVLDLLFCRAKAIMSAWNKDIANAAENSLHLSRHHVDSVLSDAVIVATHGGKLLSAWTGLSTGATPNELRIICEMLITAILSIENGQSLVLWQGERTPYNCLVSVAATQKQTDTMTITISLPKLDGSVESVTFNIMPALSAVGAADSAVRFKYCAKASRSEREAGLEGLEARNNMRVNAPRENEEAKHSTQLANHHPTVKPIALMRYLCRLITPPGGVVLDPFTGSGTTGCAAMLEGFQFIGIEREEQYVEIAQKRIEYWRQVAGHAPPSAEQAQMTLLDMQDE